MQRNIKTSVLLRALNGIECVGLAAHKDIQQHNEKKLHYYLSLTNGVVLQIKKNKLKLVC